MGDITIAMVYYLLCLLIGRLPPLRFEHFFFTPFRPANSVALHLNIPGFSRRTIKYSIRKRMSSTREVFLACCENRSPQNTQKTQINFFYWPAPFLFLFIYTITPPLQYSTTPDFDASLIWGIANKILIVYNIYYHEKKSINLNEKRRKDETIKV
jgi:hypothetical protein